jgi:ADP-L-glycero-D-manno-heptose 6-epimerase
MNLAKLDFRDYLDYRELFKNWKELKKELKAVFHQGACSDTTVTDGRYMMEINYEYSKELLIRTLDLDGVPFIYASSASVYGSGKNGFTEKSECENPLNPYAFSKFQFDRLARYAAEKRPADTVIGLRYFNVYGPGEAHKLKMASVAYHLYNQMKRGEPLKLFEGSDNFLRDFVHVDDVVAVNIHMWQNNIASGIYNCGAGKAESFTAVAEAVIEAGCAQNPLTTLEYIPFPDELKGKYQAFTQADLTKLRNEGGYKEKFMSVSEGVKRYIKALDGNI